MANKKEKKILTHTEELYVAIEPDGALTVIEYVTNTTPLRYEEVPETFQVSASLIKVTPEGTQE